MQPLPSPQPTAHQAPLCEGPPPLAALSAVVVAACLLAGPGPTRALTVAGAPLATLVQEATLIVQGQVLWTRAEPLRGRPWASRTRATVVVWRVYKPDAPNGPSPGGLDPRETAPTADPDMVDVLLPGGTRAGLTTRVPGVPTLRPGEDVLLLLRPVPGGFAPIGYGLGVRRLPRLGQRPAPLPAALAAALGDALAGPP